MMSGDPAMDSSPALKVDDEQVAPTRQPETRRNRATNRPVIASKLHDTTFTTKRLDEMVVWYKLAVGLVPVFYGEDAAWLSNDEANHCIALLSPLGLKRSDDKGHIMSIHHTGLEFKTFDQWLDVYG
jgi:catechol 2,3-dioxygenase